MTPRLEYPRPQFERDDWINLNGEWSFTFDFGKSGYERGWSESSGFERSILVPFAPESSLSGIGHTDFIEAEWYHRTFEIPSRWNGRRILLNFGGCDYRTEVFVNSIFVDRHYGGSVSFAVDISRFVNVGGKNDLVVSVYDNVRHGQQPGGKQSPEFTFHTFKCHYTRTTGIWQTVWLEAVHPLGLQRCRIIPDIDRDFVAVTPTFLGRERGAAEVSHSTAGKANIAASSGPIRALRVVVRDESGAEVSRVEERATDGTPLIVPIPSPTLWGAGSPYLYQVELEVLVDGAAVDAVKSYVGMRNVRIHGNQVLLNNEPIYQRLVLDQGFYPEGIWTAPTDEALKRDIELSMAAGFNGARLHQKTFEERFHYWADRLGYLTWGESPSWGLTPTDPLSHRNFLTEWAEILRRDWNHPSIITWTGLNETHSVQPNPPEHWRFHSDIYELTRTLDPTRPAHDASGYCHVKTDIWTSHNYTQDPDDLAKKLAIGADGQPYRNHPDREVPYDGQPYLVDEFGGIKWIPPGVTPYMNTSWGYGQGPRSEEEFYERLDGQVKALRGHEHISGFCYTQLTDVEQEQNGIYQADRSGKFDMERVSRIFRQ